jgi:uncharacterized C2H2 Zn-finger protein
MAEHSRESEINLRCPHCGQEFTQAVELLLQGAEVTCPACQWTVRYSSSLPRDRADETSRAWQNLWRKVDELDPGGQ